MSSFGPTLSIFGLLLGPVIYRLSTTIPEWLEQRYDDECLIRRWPRWEALICIECSLVLALMPLLVAQPSQPAHGLSIVFYWTLVLLALIDARSMLLPDLITLPLLVAGIFASIAGFGPPLGECLLGAMLGYSLLWVLNRASLTMNGTEGIGQGDMKLLAAIGAWQGYTTLPNLLVAASALGLFWGLVRRAMRNEPFPFGPMLCAAGIAYEIFILRY